MVYLDQHTGKRRLSTRRPSMYENLVQVLTPHAFQHAARVQKLLTVKGSKYLLALSLAHLPSSYFVEIFIDERANRESLQ